MKLKNPENKSFHDAVVRAMQPMEELGGPDKEDYIEIMETLKAEIELRIENCKNNVF